MKNKIKDILKLIICCILFLLIGDIVNIFMGVIGININEISNKGKVIYQFVLSLIMFLVLFVLYFKNIKEDFFDIKKNFSKNVRKIIKLFFVFMIIKFLVSLVSTIIMTLLGFDTNSMTSVNQNIIEGLINASPILMFISTAFLAPFYEEFLFRLGIGKVIKSKWLFIIISGTIFGLLHVFPLDEGISLMLGITQSISYVTMGILLSYVYKKHNNIFFSIGVHFLNNFISALTIINML